MESVPLSTKLAILKERAMGSERTLEGLGSWLAR